MAVVQLYHHLAPKSDVVCVAPGLLRLLRSHREVQVVVLNTIASMSVNRKVFYFPLIVSAVLMFFHNVLCETRTCLSRS